MFGSFLEVRRLGVSTLELHSAVWFVWRPDGKENVLEIMTHKTKYMVLSEIQNAVRW